MRNHHYPTPSTYLLNELAVALQQAKYPNVAEHLLAGLLWAIYPQWFHAHWEIKKKE